MGESERKTTWSGERLITGFNSLRMEGGTYAYPNTMQPTVQKVTLELNRGESIAFVGHTGCGKSTLVSLILGLLDPHEGSIAVHDVEIGRDLDGWRKQLG